MTPANLAPIRVHHVARRAAALVVAAGVVSIALAVALALSPSLRHRAAAWLTADAGPRGAERVRVDHAVDGDTLVTADGRTVRLIGIDTPETHHPDMAGPQPFGPEAAARLAALVDGQVVWLERDDTDVDGYGRQLRHVWAGGRLAAETLAAEGLGYVLIIPPNGRHEAELRAAEAAARAAKRGLWGMARPTAVAAFATAADTGASAAASPTRLVADSPWGAGETNGSPAPAGSTTSTRARRAETPPSSAANGGMIDSAQPCGARVAGAIPAEVAGDHVDTYQAVEFEVVRAKDTGKVTFLNSHDPFQGFFYAAVFPTDYAAFPAPPAEYLAGKCIVVQGRVEMYRGAPQIVVRGAEDVRVVDGPRP